MNCDTALIRIDRPAGEVFSFMADPAQMSLWSFGTWRTEIDADGLVRGTSIKDGAPICVRIEAHAEQLLIDYHVGATPEALSPRIFARVTPAEVFGDAGKHARFAVGAGSLPMGVAVEVDAIIVVD